VADDQRDEERFRRRFDERIKLIDTVIKPGFAQYPLPLQARCKRLAPQATATGETAPERVHDGRRGAPVRTVLLAVAGAVRGATSRP